MAWFDQSIDELELTVRASNALKRADLLFIREIEDKTDAELLRTPGLGKGSLPGVRAAVLRLREQWVSRG